MRATISKRVDGAYVPFLITPNLWVAIRLFMARQRRGEPVRLEIKR